MIDEKIRSDLEIILKKISDEVLYSENLLYGLHSGILGEIIFLLYSHLVYPDNRKLEAINQRLSRVILHGDKLNNSLAEGKAGLDFVLQLLIEHNILDKDVLEDYIKHRKENILSTIDAYPDDMYDYFYGYLGYLPIISYLNKPTAKMGFELIDSKLKNSLTDTHPIWTTFEKGNKKSDIINMGIPHGLLGILNFEVQRNKALNSNDSFYSDLILREINNHVKWDQEVAVPITLNEFVPTRLAWCNGDLSLLHTLKRIALYSKSDFPFTSWIETLKRKCLMRNTNNANIHDMCICHGYTGVLLRLESNRHLFSPIELQNILSYWTNNIIDHYKQKGTLYFNTDTEELGPNTGLFEGSSGTGLYILSLLYGIDDKWRIVVP